MQDIWRTGAWTLLLFWPWAKRQVNTPQTTDLSPLADSLLAATFYMWRKNNSSANGDHIKDFFLALVPIWRMYCSQSRTWWALKISLVLQNSAKMISNTAWMLAETQGDSQETTSSPYIKVIILKNGTGKRCISKLKQTKIHLCLPCPHGFFPKIGEAWWILVLQIQWSLFQNTLFIN